MLLKAPPIDTNSSKLSNTFLSFIIALAILVKGPSDIINTSLLTGSIKIYLNILQI